MCNLYGLKMTRAERLAYFAADDDFRHEVELEKDYVVPGSPGSSSARRTANAC